MKTFRITIQISVDWVKNAEDLKKLLEKECNIWAVTHCEDELEVEEVKK